MEIFDIYSWKREELLQLSFGAFVPRLLEAHHLIGVSSGELLDLAKAIEDSPFGIMGQFPPFDAKGEIYMSFELSHCEDFVIWGTEKNQRVLNDYPRRGMGSMFSFAAPISRQEAACATYERLGEFWGDYYYCIDRIADSLDDLGVVFIPLEPDGEIAIVACSRKHQNAARIPQLLKSTKLPLLRFLGSGSGLQWEKVGDWSQVE